MLQQDIEQLNHRAFPLVKLLFVFWIASTLPFFSCVNDLGDVQDVRSRATPQLESGTDVRIVYSEDGRVKIELFADSVTRHITKEPFIEFTHGLKVHFYDEDLNIKSKLTANYGLRYEKTGNTVVQDDVQMVNEKKEVLKTEKLTWDIENGKISSDEDIQIHTENEILLGKGIEADEDFTKYKILKPTGTIKVKVDEIDEDI